MAKFVWLRDSAFPRTGPKLEKGKEHDAGAYGPGVVETWVRSGAAKMMPEEGQVPKPEKKDKAAKYSGGR
jgi:hypothetical protein